MTEYRLKPKRNAYRFRGRKIDVIAELPKEAADRIRSGQHVTVIVDVPECICYSTRDSRCLAHEPVEQEL